MRRDLARLSADSHELIVVGGGIYGACAAWEAAQRGLKVALIEAADFGHATSSNSLRTLHGGLRHLQRLDFVRMRESIRERREWLRLAPHLARPLRFVLPTSGHGLKGPLVLRAALWANDLVSFDRNRGVSRDHWLPGGRVWSQERVQVEFPGLSLPHCNGAAAWYDAVCLNTERLQLSIVMAAVAAGALAANYTRALRLLVEDGEVRGVRVRDELTGREIELRARAVINATGPWVDEWAGPVLRQRVTPLFHASKAFNLLTRALPFRAGLGLSIPARARARNGESYTCFIIPWQGRSLIGTRHLRCEHSVRSARISREEVMEFLTDLNSVLGEQRVCGTDVFGVFAGLLPEEVANVDPSVALERAPRVINHARQGIKGLVSIVGVKWTTARAVAEQAVAMACEHSLAGRTPRALFEIDSRAGGSDMRPAMELEPGVLVHLEESYGAGVDSVLALIREDSTLAGRVVPDMPIVLGQVVHATRAEMACRLKDVVRRRTPLYLSEALDRSALSACASVMARELRWSRREIGAQIDEAEAELAAFRGPLRADPRIAAA